MLISYKSLCHKRLSSMRYLHVDMYYEKLFVFSTFVFNLKIDFGNGWKCKRVRVKLLIRFSYKVLWESYLNKLKTRYSHAITSFDKFFRTLAQVFIT